MKYTISQVSKAMNIPTSTLRYYDKEGLLPTLERKESGYRLFSDTEIEMLELIECLKEIGLSIKDIKSYVKLTQLGDETLNERYLLFLEKKNVIEQQMEKLKQSMKIIDRKCQYYESALEAGTEQIHFPIQMSAENKKRFEQLAKINIL